MFFVPFLYDKGNTFFVFVQTFFKLFSTFFAKKLPGPWGGSGWIWSVEKRG